MNTRETHQVAPLARWTGNEESSWLEAVPCDGCGADAVLFDHCGVPQCLGCWEEQVRSLGTAETALMLVAALGEDPRLDAEDLRATRSEMVVPMAVLVAGGREAA